MIGWWNKNCPILHNIAQKVARQIIFTLKLQIWNNPNIYQNIWNTFVRKFVAKKFKNRPIWSHCLLRHLGTLSLYFFSLFKSILRLNFCVWRIDFPFLPKNIFKLNNSWPLLCIFVVSVESIGNVKFADVLIWTADPSCGKRPLYQLSHNHILGGCHSSVVSSVPTILWTRVWIPSTLSMLFSICNWIVMWKGQK